MAVIQPDGNKGVVSLDRDPMKRLDREMLSQPLRPGSFFVFTLDPFVNRVLIVEAKNDASQHIGIAFKTKLEKATLRLIGLETELTQKAFRKAPRSYGRGRIAGAFGRIIRDLPCTRRFPVEIIQLKF